MTRVWSMASERSDTQDCVELENAIIYVCAGAHRQSSPTQPLQPPPLPLPPQTPTPQLPLTALPPDSDSGYEASPSSATRLTSFQFESSTDSTLDSTLDEELLSIDLIFAPIMLYESDVLNNNYEDVEEDEEEEEVEDISMRAESRNSGGSGGSDRLMSTPIPIPVPSTSRNSLVSTSHLMSGSGVSRLSSLSLSHSNMTFATNSNRFNSDCDERGFGREMFARYHRHRYHIGMDAISPQSPPSCTYWSPYIMGMVSPYITSGHRSHHNNHNHNHYQGFDESLSSTRCPLSYAQELHLPSPLSSISFSSQMSGRVHTNPTAEQSRDREDQNHNHLNEPLPDVVNVEVRVRSHNGHTQARRAVSVSLPIDAETIRSVGVSLRQISEEFERSTSRMMLSNPERRSDGMVGNMLASIRLSRRSLSSRFRSHHNNHNNLIGRTRSFSTNDAPEE